MGFLSETDQATTSGQAGPKKLPNRHPLPGEKADPSQQLAMDVMAQVSPAWLKPGAVIVKYQVACTQVDCAELYFMAVHKYSKSLVLPWIQIQRDASMADKFLPPLPFVDTVQAPCIMAIAKHHEDGRFMATFLNQVQLCYARSATACYCSTWQTFCVKHSLSLTSARTITTKPLAFSTSMSRTPCHKPSAAQPNCMIN